MGFVDVEASLVRWRVLCGSRAIGWNISAHVILSILIPIRFIQPDKWMSVALVINVINTIIYLNRHRIIAGRE